MTSLCFYFLIFYFSSLRSALYTVYLWQLKEYRIDRMKAHLNTLLGKRWIFGFFAITKLILLTVLFLFIRPDLLKKFSPILLIISPDSETIALLVFYTLFIILYYGVPALFLLESFLFFKDSIVKRQKYPTQTIKAMGIIIIYLFVLFLVMIFSYPIYSSFFALQAKAFLEDDLFPESLFLFSFFLLLFNKLTPLLIAFLVFTSNLFSKGVQKITIFRAKEKLEKFPKLIRIGITGSFGKTSTKEFLATLLSIKYSVAKTEKMVNTEIGIAQTILKNDFGSTDIFIAEMGAYKKGEIAGMCDVVKPNMSVVTGIGDQHFDLFGGREKLMEAKFEIVTSLPAGSPVFFNGQNAGALELAEKARKREYQVFCYGRQTDEVFADEVEVLPDYLEFVLNIKKQKKKARVNLRGIQNLPNILASVCVSSYLGLTIKEICEGLDNSQSPEKTMEKKGEYNGAYLIDDTFNASSSSVHAALEYLKAFPGNTYLVLQPLIELGNQAETVHRELGRKCVQVCSKVFLTNPNYYDSLTFSLSEKEKEHMQISTPQTISAFLKENLKKGDAVIFEGKEARASMEKLV